MKHVCRSCPHVVGDTYQRDCGYPDCSSMRRELAPPFAMVYPPPLIRARFILALLLAGMLWLMLGCSEPPAAPMSICLQPDPTVFTLTSAPPGETVLQRWKRTKADWERAQALEREEEDRRPSLQAITPYMDAERALATADCKDVCPAAPVRPSAPVLIGVE